MDLNYIRNFFIVRALQQGEKYLGIFYFGMLQIPHIVWHSNIQLAPHLSVICKPQTSYATKPKLLICDQLLEAQPVHFCHFPHRCCQRAHVTASTKLNYNFPDSTSKKHDQIM